MGRTAIVLAAAGLVLYLGMRPVVADTPGCASITDNSERAVCHTKSRRSYGAQLEQKLADLGSQGSVFVEEVGDPQSGAYPRMIVWTFLTKERVNELISAARILEGARRAGFRMLVFIDKGKAAEHWYFDLTKAATAPLDVVPPNPPPWRR